MVKSYLRGHEIEYDGNRWVYSDTKEPTVEAHRERPCGHCGLSNTPEGYDGCLGELAGVKNACCGHGRINEAYVQYEDGRYVRGLDVMEVLRSVNR